MKKIILSIALFFMLQNIIFTQNTCIPNYIHLNAVARNASGTPVVPPQQIDVKVELFSGNPTAGGTLIYCEQQQNISTNTFGEFALDFGNPALICNPPAVLMSGVDWTKCDIYYRLSWRITGGNYTPIATGPFTSVPYAFAARTAERVKRIPYAQARSTTGWISTTQTNTYLSHPSLTLTVPENGTYLVNSNLCLYAKNYNCDARIINLNDPNARTIVSIGVGATNNAGTTDGATCASDSQIVSLTAGQILQLQILNVNPGQWFYGAQTNFNIVRLGD